MTGAGRDLTDGDRLLTPTEVAKAMRVDPKTVTRWIGAGRFPNLPHDRYPGIIRTLSGGIRIRESLVRGLLDGSLIPKEGGDGKQGDCTH